MKMILQDVLFASRNIDVPFDLYYRSDKNTMSFDTYFNMFSLEKWLRYTNVWKFGVTIKYRGTHTLTLKHSYLVKGRTVCKSLSSHNLNSDECVEATFYYPSEINTGMLFFSINTQRQEDILEIKYVGDVLEKRNINLAETSTIFVTETK